jgi:uncharacterized protein YdeI (YjbR/CyaY-like superfamily)
MIPDPRKIKSFRTAAAFEAWLAKHHASETEVWLKVVLCWGWIDGLRKGFDERSYLQRYTPRRPRSPWSQISKGHVARLSKALRMTPAGQRQVDAAKADGRWAAATGTAKKAR